MFRLSLLWRVGKTPLEVVGPRKNAQRSEGDGWRVEEQKKARQRARDVPSPAQTGPDNGSLGDGTMLSLSGKKKRALVDRKTGSQNGSDVDRPHLTACTKAFGPRAAPLSGIAKRRVDKTGLLCGLSWELVPWTSRGATRAWHYSLRRDCQTEANWRKEEQGS